MSVRYQNRVRFWREMTQSIVDAGRVRLNARTKCYAQKVHAREVRIDQQGVSFEFELVTVRAEISHAHAVARRRARIVHYQLRIMIRVQPQKLARRISSQKKNAHATTDNADVTDREAKAASDTKALQICSSRVGRVASF